MVDNSGWILQKTNSKSRRIIIPCHTKDKSIANKMRQTLEYQALMQFYSPVQQDRYKSFNELCALYLKDKNIINNLSKASYATTKWVLNDYLKFKQLPSNKSSRVQYAGRLNTVINWGIKKQLQNRCQTFRYRYTCG